MFTLPEWMRSLPMQAFIILLVSAFLGCVVYRLSFWWGCRRGRKRLRVMEQDLAVEMETNGSHLRSLTAMVRNSPRDSGIMRALDE